MYVSTDSETDLISAGRLDPDLVCITVCDQETLEPELYDHFEAEEVLAELLANEDVVQVGVNFAFDAAVIIRRYPRLLKLIFAAYRAGRILDVGLAQSLIDIANGELGGTFNHMGVYVKYYYSMAALHERWGLGTLAKEDTWRLRYGEIKHLRKADYPEAAKKYALDDASAGLKIWLMQVESYPHFLKDLAAQSRAAFALHLMAVRGIHTDAQACDEYLEAVKTEIDGYKTLLEQTGLLRANGSKDTKAAQKYMAAAAQRAGVTPKETDASKPDAIKLSLDAEACRDVNDPVMKAYAAFTSAKTTLTRVEKLKLGSTDVPLQTRFTPLVNNGRSASSEPSAPLVGLNLQNLPRGGMSRQVFVPRKGYVFCSCDFTGAELHTFAQCEKWLTGKSLIGDALNQQLDLHCHLAAAFLECSYEEAVESKKVGKYAWARQLCKNVNFGCLAYMGAQRLMETINKSATKTEEKIDLATAQKLRQVWLDTWQTQPYFDYVKEMLSTSGLVTVEQFVSGRVRGKLNFTELANTLFSGLAADSFKAAMWDLTEACYVQKDSALYGSRLLLPVHDEIITELVDGDDLHEKAFEQARIMCEAFTRYVPEYPVRAEPAIMKVWFKAADPAFDSNGRLRCWTPQMDDKSFKPEKYLKRALELCVAEA